MSNFPRMHVSLYVSDIPKTVQFYETFFGVTANKVKDDYAKFVLEKPSLIISFVQNSSKITPGFGHLGFQVETSKELEDRLALAKNNEMIYLEETGTNCCYATQDKFWVKDPDGYMWEVYYFHADAEFNDPRYDSSNAEACCTPSKEKQKVALSDIGFVGSCEPESGCC